jgi:diguanylate cyclase (GGDEF)-like protein/PAS domain S-box-containing protein
MIGKPLAQIVPQDAGEASEELLGKVRDGSFACCDHVERLCKNRSRVRVALRRRFIRNERGEITGMLEIAEREDKRGPQAIAETQLRLLLEQMPAVMWATDRNLRITSNWGAGLLGAKIEPGELTGQSLHEYLKCKDPHASPIGQHTQALEGVSSHFEYRHADRDFEVHLGPLRSPAGEIIGCIGAGIDVTDRKRSEEQIRYQATHDALTGLANYRGFVDTLEREVRRAERIHHSFAVLLVDLDELKRVNDRFGHLAGNRALKRLAGVIQEHCRATDVAARYGGDEFAVVLIDADPGMARQIAERVDAALRAELEEPTLSASIGIGVYPDDGRTAQELLEAADQNLYKRKKAARGQGVAAP